MPTSKGGVALLIHISISPQARDTETYTPWQLSSTNLSLHADPSLLHVRVLSFKGRHSVKAKHTCEPHLDKLVMESANILRQFTRVTIASHTTPMNPNMCPWCIAKEKPGALADMLLPHSKPTPYTRVPRYNGCKSYIDGAYKTRMFTALFEGSVAYVPSFERTQS